MTPKVHFSVVLFCLISAAVCELCPLENGEYVDFVLHEYDCTKFYKCDWGELNLYDCPSGLHFNPTLNVCDWPENAGCNSGSSSTPRPTVAPTVAPTASPTTSPTAPPQTPPPTSTTTGSGNNGPQGVCPPVNGEFVVFLPHEYDCTKFYKCDWGVPILFNCPSGLHFNSTLNVCDWPENAGCNSGSSSTPRPTVAPTASPTTSPTVPPQTPPPTSTTTGSGNNGPQGVCPPVNGEFVDFLPHESDCTKFYKCDWGVPILFDCPSGLHFNLVLNVCDWPENAGCR